MTLLCISLSFCGFILNKVIPFMTICLVQCNQIFIVWMSCDNKVFFVHDGKLKKSFSQKLQHLLNPYCTWKIIWYIYHYKIFLLEFELKIQYRYGCKFNIEPYKKNIVSLFFSEITEPFERKLCWNAPFIVFYKMCLYFVSVRNSRWPPPQYTV